MRRARLAWLVVLSYVCGLPLPRAGAQEGAAPNPGPVLRIALLADPHVSVRPDRESHGRHFTRVIEEVNAADVDAVLIAGDLTQGGTPEEWEAFQSYVIRFKVRPHLIPGNHDVGGKPLAGKPLAGKPEGPSVERLTRYAQQAGADHYAIDLRDGVRLIAANASLFGSGAEAEAAQWAFLERELSAEAGGIRLLLTHYPPFVNDPDEADDYFNIEPASRQRLLELARRGKVSAVLSGHLHRLIQSKTDGLLVLTAPAISFGLPRERQPVGWMLVSIHGDGRIEHELRYLPNDDSAAVRAIEPDFSDRVHIFYYTWYGAPPHEPGFVHWQQGNRTPPLDVGANFFPKLGAYSSSDPEVLRQHMRWLAQARVGVLSVTWWGRGSYEDQRVRAVMDAAAEQGLKVNFHLEPYPGFGPAVLARDIEYIVKTYGEHPAFYRGRDADGTSRPLFYLFETLRHPAADWNQAIAAIRGTRQDAVLLAQTTDLRFVVAGSFDGGYTYDVLLPFVKPETLDQWVRDMAPQFAAAGKLFVPSVGPGYWDDRAVPRGATEPDAAKSRDGGTGQTYSAGWKAAIQCEAPIVTITSFNEWHEGTQIEPAVERDIDGYRYPGYRGGSEQYLEQTADWVEVYENAVAR